MSGVDELQGTADDYTIKLMWMGVDSDADIVIRFDRATGYAGAQIATQRLFENHRVMVPGRVISYNPNLPNGRSWFLPMAERIGLEIRELSVEFATLRIQTEMGKRYAIAASPNLVKGSWSTRDIRAELKGSSLQETGAEYLFFIAESDETILNIERSGALQDLAFFSAYEVVAKAFTPPAAE